MAGMGGYGGGGMAGYLANRQYDQLQQNQFLNQQLLQGGQQAQQRNLQRQREEFEREQQERENTLMEQRQWQSPEAVLGFRKQGDVEQQRQNIANFYTAAGKLPLDAPLSTYLGLAGQYGVPPEALNSLLLSRQRSQTPTDKFLDQNIGQVKGSNFFSPTGEAPTDPFMTVRDAYKAGYVMLNDRDAESMRSSQAARENLNGLLSAGNAILPEKPSFSAGYIDPWIRAVKTKEGYAQYQDYQHAMAGIIPYMISLNKVGRVSQEQLQLVVEALRNANTQEGLKAAVDRANAIIDNEQAYLAKVGRLAVAGRVDAGGDAGGLPSMSVRPDAGAPPAGSGLVPLRIEGGKVIYRGPDGKEYVR